MLSPFADKTRSLCLPAAVHLSHAQQPWAWISNGASHSVLLICFTFLLHSPVVTALHLPSIYPQVNPAFLQRVFLISTLLRTSSHCELVFKSLTFPWRHHSQPSVETSSTEVAASTLKNNIKYNTKVSWSQQRQNSMGRTRQQKSTQIRPFDTSLYRNLLGRCTVAVCTQKDLSCWQS